MASLLNQSLPLLILELFVLLVGISEVGFFLGRVVTRASRENMQSDPGVDNNVSTITTSSLALLALFLGFTFSSALDHFEKNRDAVTNEATSITIAYQLATLQPEPYKEKLSGALGQYIDIRQRVANLPDTSQAIRELQAESRVRQNELWDIVEEMARKIPNAAFLDKFVDALSNMIATEETRTENLINGVPKGMFLPVGIFLLFNGLLLGVSLGEGARRHVVLSWGLYLLVAIVVGIIIDLDHPLKGFINVNQDAMTILKENRR